MTKKKADNSEPKGAYTVRSPLRFDGDRYKIGDVVELTERQAAALGDVIGPPPPEATKPGTAAEQSKGGKKADTK